MQGLVRSTLWLGFFGVILAAWVFMYAMSAGMGLDLLGRPRMMMGGMEMGAPGLLPLFGMWAAMMAAMMLPTMVPTLRAYEDLMRSADGTRAGWLAMLAGYLTVWVGFAALIAAAQVGLMRLGLLDRMGAATSALIAAALLVAVGLYQFTRAKEICHGVCHSPMMYFLGHWRPGVAGGLRMGAGLGVYCVGCCWGFMALGFAGGVMNLAWMGLATAFMVLEKLPQVGHRVMRPGGALLIGAGALWLTLPYVGG